jgi:hypothetical protein
LRNLKLGLSLDSVGKFERHGSWLRVLVVHLSPALMVHLHISIVILTMPLGAVRFFSDRATNNRYPLAGVACGRL